MAADSGTRHTTPADPTDVWYAAYGSNLERARLRLYLEGGTHPVTRRVTPGCRNPAAPLHDRSATLPFPVLFARHSLGWDGAIAFLDSDRPGRAVVRLWRITLEQFADIVAQENVAPAGTVDPCAISDLGPSRPAASVIATGWYGRVLWCGELEGLPILTCTADWDLGAEAQASPAPAYLATMARGLSECGHDAGAIVSYLGALAGVAPHWPPERIHSLLAEGRLG